MAKMDDYTLNSWTWDMAKEYKLIDSRICATEDHFPGSGAYSFFYYSPYQGFKWGPINKEKEDPAADGVQDSHEIHLDFERAADSESRLIEWIKRYGLPYRPGCKRSRRGDWEAVIPQKLYQWQAEGVVLQDIMASAKLFRWTAHLFACRNQIIRGSAPSPPKIDADIAFALDDLGETNLVPGRKNNWPPIIIGSEKADFWAEQATIKFVKLWDKNPQETCEFFISQVVNRMLEEASIWVSFTDKKAPAAAVWRFPSLLSCLYHMLLITNSGGKITLPCKKCGRLFIPDKVETAEYCSKKCRETAKKRRQRKRNTYGGVDNAR